MVDIHRLNMHLAIKEALSPSHNKVNLHVCKQGRVVELTLTILWYTRHTEGSREYKEMYMGERLCLEVSLYGSGAV